MGGCLEFVYNDDSAILCNLTKNLKSGQMVGCTYIWVQLHNILSIKFVLFHIKSEKKFNLGGGRPVITKFFPKNIDFSY